MTAEPLPTVEEKARPRTFYVPTHAAASFARTVSPRSPIRIEERDEDEDEDGSGSSGRKKCHTTTTTTTTATATTTSISNSNYTHSRSPKAASYYQADAAAASPPPSRSDAPSTDYAAFLAQAEVNERAARARMAPPRRQETGRAWCQLNGSTAVGGTAALRDSAYYSTGSRSSSRGRGRGRGEGAGAGAGEDTVAPLPARRQPRTLGRRLSEYFKPPHREGCLDEMG